jgi:hypothetical protein
LPTPDAFLDRADHTATDRRERIKDEIGGFGKSSVGAPLCLKLRPRTAIVPVSENRAGI